MKKLRVGVVGLGHLGSIHARIYKALGNCQLAGVCDIDLGRLEKISRELDAPAFADYRQLFGRVDAASIAVPTRLHYQVASDFLLHEAHTLVEKPFASSLEEAKALIKTAREKKLILQVGHIERFNSAFAAAQKIIHRPKFIECHRLSPFPHRSLDIGAVLDIMIHDIDIVLGLVNSPVKEIDAVGVNVLTHFEDIANARLRFADGCVANLTASRVSDEAMRKIRIFQENAYISLDYKEAAACVYRREGNVITKSELPIEKEQPLQKELAAFAECCLRHHEPLVSGEVAAEALGLALKIQKAIWRKDR
jgi:predicted dehydrogenase